MPIHYTVGRLLTYLKQHEYIISLACAACCVVSLDQCQLVSCDSPDVLVVSCGLLRFLGGPLSTGCLRNNQSRTLMEWKERQNWMDIE